MFGVMCDETAIWLCWNGVLLNVRRGRAVSGVSLREHSIEEKKRKRAILIGKGT